MPSERLAVLQRQRQILAEHLNWLDAEIAAEEKTSTPDSAIQASREVALPSSPLPEPSPPRANPPAQPDAPADSVLKEADPEALARANALADTLIKEYRAQNPHSPESTRRSCLLLTVAFGLFGVAGLMGLYWFFYR
jgi:hypothetical protein